MSTTTTVANPAPLGLSAFGMTTVLLSLANAGIIELSSMIIAMAIFYGGIAQVIAGIMEGKKGNTFGLATFTSFGLFWLSFAAMLILPKLGWADAASKSAVVAYLIMWEILSICLFFATLKFNRAVQFVFVSLIILLAFLIAGDITGNASLTALAGYTGIVCGASALYTGMAGVLNEVYGRDVLPIGPVQ